LNFQPNQSGIEIVSNIDVFTSSISFNRTKVELKFRLLPSTTPVVPTFNRTKVELKYLDTIETILKVFFQPNQSGIEIESTGNPLPKGGFFQPNQSGIEIIQSSFESLKY